MALWKHLRKALLRNQGHNFWGHRAFLTLWVPKAAYPTPRPEIPAALRARLGAEDEMGAWRTRHDDGRVTLVSFSSLSSAGDPRERRGAGDAVPVGVTSDGHGGWDWMEAYARTGKPSGDDGYLMDDEVQHDTGAPEWSWLCDVCEVLIAQRAWDDTARRLDWCSDDARAAFGECAFWAKTTYPTEDATRYGVIFSVKPFIASYVREFSVNAARLTRALRADGVVAWWSA